jgi:hypothetical protein
VNYFMNTDNYGQQCCTPYQSPIVIDVAGTGFDLTSSENGVLFDFFGTGARKRISWTAAGSTNAWLVLDRNGDGLINSAKEMFGSITDQPPSDHPNGFLALAVFDRPENGGNSDGVIDYRDSVYSKLRLWQDKNHNGISEPEELHTLAELGVASISLRYTESRWKDANGNTFRYRGIIKRRPEASDGIFIYDVALVPDN